MLMLMLGITVTFVFFLLNKSGSQTLRQIAVLQEK